MSVKISSADHLWAAFVCCLGSARRCCQDGCKSVIANLAGVSCAVFLGLSVGFVAVASQTAIAQEKAQFSVQIGAFKNPRPEVLQSLAAFGAVSIQAKDQLFRVLVGNFANKNEALRLQRTLVAEGYSTAFIRQIDLQSNRLFSGDVDGLAPAYITSSRTGNSDKPPPLGLSEAELFLSTELEEKEVNAASVAQDCRGKSQPLMPRVNNTRCRSITKSNEMTLQVASVIALDRPKTPIANRRLATNGSPVSEYQAPVVDESLDEYQDVLSAARAQPTPSPRPEDYVAAVPLPDRWRLLEGLGDLNKWYDPYNQNVLKADFPVNDDWFFNLTAISDTVVEARTVPTPVGLQSTRSAGSNDVFGNYQQSAIIQNVALEFVYYKGDTVFKPVDWEFRFTPVFNINHTQVDEILAVNADPGKGTDRTKTYVGIQSAFVDKHWRNVSDNYDFDSVRVGIQPFSSDFRGFLFQDSPFGVRLFGNRANNKLQYNIAWFRRLDKDVNSGLNDVSEGLRKDDLFIANLYWQDQPTLGFTPEILFAYNRNRETDVTFDANNFITRPASIGLERPRTYDVYYLGLGGDGHFGRLNLTSMFYWVTGKEQGSVFSGVDSDVDAMFFALEPSIDFDWARFKLSMLYASGDSDPYDNKSEAFDAIFENPIFAGADTSYWVRQAVPLIGGGRVALSSRNGLLNSMRSSKEQGQSNFTNPGLILLGGGVDLDLLPQLRLSFNANYLQFAETGVLEYARATRNIDREIGLDLSAALIWRPFMTQNIVARLSYAKLFAGSGFVDLYGEEDPYSVLANVVFTW